MNGAEGRRGQETQWREVDDKIDRGRAEMG